MRALIIRLLGGSLTLAAVVYGQQVPASDKPAVIEGRVLDAVTGAPLRKTQLTLRPAGPQTGAPPASIQIRDPLGAVIAGAGAQPRRQLSISTDNEGRYQFIIDQTGAFRVSASRTGYVAGEYGSRRPGAGGKAVTVAAGQHLSGIDVKLTPHGVIAGRVVDQEGDPVERAQVTVTTRLAANAPNGTSRSISSVTNDLGEFRIAGLAAGKYYVMANRIGVVLSDGEDDASATGQETYAATYFPGVTDSSAAATVAVAPGQQVTGIFVPLRKARVFKVTGVISGLIETPGAAEPAAPKIIGPDGRVLTPGAARAAVNRVIVNLVERNETGRGGLQRMLNSRVMNPDGSFEVPNVPAGSYWALAISSQRGAAIVGRTPVEVRNGNVLNVVVPVAPPVTINGTTKADGRETLAVPNARIRLSPVGDTVGMASANVQANGAFQIPSASRSRYRVTAQNLPDGAYLKAVLVNGVDITKTGLDLTTAAITMPLELVFSSKAASVAGTVKLSPENLPGRALLVPDPYADNQPEAPPVGTPITVTDAGTFTIKNVPPGSYRLYAFEDVDFATVDAAMLKRLESRSEKLALAEGATANVELKQISAEESSTE